MKVKELNLKELIEKLEISVDFKNSLFDKIDNDCAAFAISDLWQAGFMISRELDSNDNYLYCVIV